MTTDILAAIDAATEQRCACGCGQPLPAGGLSAWFASQDCQHQWHQRNATDPHEVYDRDDFDSYPGALPDRAPVSSPSARLYRRPAAPVQPQPVAAEVVVTMSDGGKHTYAFPEGVNPTITLESGSDLDDDPTALWGPMRRRIVTNQHVTMTIAVSSMASSRDDGTLLTMTVPPEAVPR